MKILHVYKSYYPYTFGGIEKCIEMLCDNAKNNGVESTILSVGDCCQIETKIQDGITEIYYPKTIEKFSCPISFSLLKDFRLLIKNYDLIHYHFPWPFSDILSLTAHGNKPYIITYHSDIIRQKIMMPFYYPLMHYFLSRAKKIVATSENYVKSSVVLKRFQEKTCVVPIGINDFANKDYGKINLPMITKPYFLFMGVLRQYKGLPFLLKAMKGVSDYQLIIAGNGPCFSELKKIIETEELKNVFLIGCVTEEQKYQLYQNAYAVVVPSHLRNEAYCYTLVEGLMFGKPLISTELNTGTSFVNQDGETGVVVSPADFNALRKAMDYLFENKAVSEKFSGNARARFLCYFTADKMTKMYIELYRTILK